MKKKFVFIIFVFLLIPFNVCFASSIKSVEFRGPESATVGDKIYASLLIEFEGIHKGDINSDGIAAVSYEINFDDEVLEIIDIGSDGDIWDSEISKNGDNYIITAAINEKDPFKNKCIDGYLYCASYLETITFLVKDTNKSSVTFSWGNVQTGVMPVSKIQDLETIDDIIDNLQILTYRTSTGLWPLSKIEINKKDEISNNEPSKNNVVSKENNIVKNNTANNSESDEDKTKNCYIKSLKIKGYNIDFHKKISIYNLNVAKDVNSLDLEVELEDENSRYEIIGADNLKENNYEVKIKVISVDKKIKTYTIKVSYNEESENNKNSDKKFSKKQIIAISIGVGLILLSIISLKVALNIKDRKKFKNFDKF